MIIIAKKQNTLTQPNIGGFSIYQDKKGRILYYQRYQKIGYVLNHHIPEYRKHSSRWIISILTTILLHILNFPIYISLLGGLLIFVLLEYRFYKFLSSLTKVPNFQPEQKLGYLYKERSLPKNKLYIKVILYFLLSILLTIHAYTTLNYPILTYAISMLACILGCIDLYVIYKK